MTACGGCLLKAPAADTVKEMLLVRLPKRVAGGLRFVEIGERGAAIFGVPPADRRLPGHWPTNATVWRSFDRPRGVPTLPGCRAGVFSPSWE